MIIPEKPTMNQSQTSPLFSVVIPAYNNVEFVSATLESVLCQTFTDFEVIVVDDGSTDGTREILEKYAKHFRVIHQHNQGPGAARNCGILEASGRYVAFLDSDDLWFPWTLEVFAHAVSSHADPAWLLGRPMIFSDQATLRNVRRDTDEFVWHEDFYSFREKEWIKVIAASSLAVGRMDILQNSGGFVEGELNAEDTDLFMRTGRRRGFIQILSPMTLGYRRNERSLTASLEGRCRGIRFLMVQEERGVYPKDPASRCHRDRYIGWCGRRFSIKCLKGARPDLGMDLYCRTLRYQMKYRHFKYLAGYPILAVFTWLKRCRTITRF